MTAIKKKVRVMRWRLEWLNFCRRLMRLVLVALIVMTIYVIVGKGIRLPVRLDIVGSWTAGAAVLLALLWAILTRTSLHDAAIVTDRKMALRERLSTALLLPAPKTDMEVAVLADAAAHAQPLRAHRVFPMPVWRDLYYMPIPVIAMALVGLFVPEMDWLGKKKGPAESPLPTESQRELAKRLDSFQRELEKMAKTAPPVRMREFSSEMDQLLRNLQSQQVSRTDVLKSLSNMSDRVAGRKEELEKKLAGAQKLDPLRSSAMTKKLTEALAKGNFDQAKTELGKLSDQLKKGDFSKDQMAKLSSDLKGLSDALKDNPALSQALAQAAKNLDAGDLGKALADLQLSAKELLDLAEALKQMNELDQIAQCLIGLQAGQCCGCGCSTCSKCSCYAASLAAMRKFREGATDKYGPGMGGPGRGAGGTPEFKETPTQFQPTKTKMKMDKGDIIGIVRVWGPQVKGEASAKFEQTYFEYRQAAEDTLARENIPLEYRTLVRDYFDAIRPATAEKKNDE